MGSGDEGYRVPAAAAEAELKEKGSRFLALLYPVSSAEAATTRLEAVRQQHPDATHHCWAWRLGAVAAERAADDGEPAGTAGKPMLQVLRGEDLSDVLAVVVRWFGGTKLGKGGLARAYAGATRLALGRLPVARKVPTETLLLELPYDRLGPVKRLLNPPAVQLVGERYGAAVELTLRVERRHRRGLEAALADLGLAPSPAAGAENGETRE